MYLIMLKPAVRLWGFPGFPGPLSALPLGGLGAFPQTCWISRTPWSDQPQLDVTVGIIIIAVIVTDHESTLGRHTGFHPILSRER